MERKDNFTKRAASNRLPHQVTVGGNLTSSSSSHSSSSPPDFLHQVRAALKHRKPLGARAVRVLDSLPKSSKSSGAFAPPSREGNAGKGLSQTLVAKGATRLTKEIPSKTGMTLPVNSSLTPPSVTSSFTDEHEGNVKSNQFGRQNDDSEMHDCQLELQIVQASEGLKQVQPFSAFSVQQPSHKYNGVLGNIIHVDEKAFHQQNAQNVQTSVSDAPFSEASRKENEPCKNRQFFQPATRSTLMQSSCVTTISAHSAPTFQYTGAPSTQMVGSTSQNIVGLLDSSHPEGKRVMFSEASSMKEKQDLNCEDIAKREVAANSNCLESHFPATSASSNPDIKPPQTIKSEKAARRKKYESNACFTVNGKLYQKLGKIGSGGSSEVHKVISTDCTIYALKKIKLKDRDYATTYGFCQEIGYLTKLKGKSNIIDLVDYEVTDKTLLQQAMEESITLKDGRIKGDEYIYMVLEYGEIDLAHMLMQKFKDMNCPSWNIDENWLRFYWQQMLEAVNTIHEERIVHSDLKPANFLLVKGSLKLIDFGIAKAIMSDTTNIQRDTQAGTLNYMPPEAYMWDEQDQAGGTIKCGRPSDIWSLGCILYQMVYGKTPFANYKTFLAKFNVITNANHEIIYEPVANPCLIDLMKRCLTWDRNKRWRIPQLLEHPFLKPPVPKEPNYHPFDALFDRVRLHRDEPEVSRLCSELRDVVSKLERDREQVRLSQTQKAST